MLFLSYLTDKLNLFYFFLKIIKPKSINLRLCYRSVKKKTKITQQKEKKDHELL